MEKPNKPDMVRLVVLIPRGLHAELQAIRAVSGVTIGAQCRFSLTQWVRACARNPHGANGLIGNEVAFNYRKGARKAGEWLPGQPGQAIGPEVDDAPDPEPNQSQEPAAWAKWAARQGNKAIANLAKGLWPKPSQDED